MFAQANSEHCRHKIFNADFTIDGVPQERSMFAMIRHTHAAGAAAHGGRLQRQRVGDGRRRRSSAGCREGFTNAPRYRRARRDRRTC